MGTPQKGVKIIKKRSAAPGRDTFWRGNTVFAVDAKES
jgi:hypothetical protein